MAKALEQRSKHIRSIFASSEHGNSASKSAMGLRIVRDASTEASKASNVIPEKGSHGAKDSHAERMQSNRTMARPGFFSNDWLIVALGLNAAANGLPNASSDSNRALLDRVASATRWKQPRNQYSGALLDHVAPATQSKQTRNQLSGAMFDRVAPATQSKQSRNQSFRAMFDRVALAIRTTDAATWSKQTRNQLSGALLDRIAAATKPKQQRK